MTIEAKANIKLGADSRCLPHRLLPNGDLYVKVCTPRKAKNIGINEQAFMTWIWELEGTKRNLVLEFHPKLGITQTVPGAVARHHLVKRADLFERTANGRFWNIPTTFFGELPITREQLS